MSLLSLLVDQERLEALIKEMRNKRDDVKKAISREVDKSIEREITNEAERKVFISLNIEEINELKDSLYVKHCAKINRNINNLKSLRKR